MTATATAETKPKQATWRDWMREVAPDVQEPEHLLTRDEFIERANRLGADVDETRLRFWEYHGVLPRAVKRWDPDVRANRVYYPTWMLGTVVLLRELQEADLSLDEIRPILRKHAKDAIETADSYARLRRDHPGALDDLDDDLTIGGTALRFVMDVVLTPTISQLMQKFSRLAGAPVVQARVEFRTEERIVGGHVVVPAESLMSNES